MELLVKETVTLHKVLSRYLSTPIVEVRRLNSLLLLLLTVSQYVMSQVFAAINHRLSEEYGQIELQSQGAKDRHVTSVETSIKVPHLTIRKECWQTHSSCIRSCRY